MDKQKNLKSYIGSKIVQARPMTNHEWSLYKGDDTSGFLEEGYYILYPDGYESWSPEKAFQAYRELTDSEIKMISDSLQNPIVKE